MYAELTLISFSCLERTYMTTTVWTDEALQLLYGILLRKVGPYNPNTWGPTKPEEYTKDEWVDLLTDVHRLLCTSIENTTPRKPASVEAVRVQIVTAVNDKTPMGGQLNALPMQRRNRHAAYLAGFMTMRQIVAKEEDDAPDVYKYSVVAKPKHTRVHAPFESEEVAVAVVEEMVMDETPYENPTVFSASLKAAFERIEQERVETEPEEVDAPLATVDDLEVPDPWSYCWE